MKNKRVFIGNLNFEATEKDLNTLFSEFGTVVGITMRRKKGFAFVEMGDADEAAEAVGKLGGVNFMGREIRISLEMKPGKAKTITVKNYKEREANLYRERSGKNADPRSRREKQRDFSRFDSENREKPEKYESSRRKPGSDYKRENSSAGEYRKGRSSSPGHKKASWTNKKKSDSQWPQNKKRSGDKHPDTSNRSGDDVNETHGRSFNGGCNYRAGVKEGSEDIKRDRKKLGPARGSQNRFSRSSGPKKNSSRKKLSKYSWPKSNGGASGGNRNKRD